ncbi:IS110 family transposase [Sphingomonas azotifigens]|uniref:IS110 family transposase n=1 Tax=Sphingomonas azotifigens TaxID=330920 RepID=UPI000A039653|nr:IS110 family transposase [Sphingomonas azotifigens]
MNEVTTIGLDIGKRVLQVHGADAVGNAIIQRKLRREEVLPFFAKLPPCLVGMEACGTSHHWAREIGKLGHDARLIPPNYVKPYVARQKNDAADAAAICEAVTRPAVRTTPVKSVDQQAARVLQRAHELLARQRVKLINAMRGHMAEFGVIVPSGTQNLNRLMERISDPDAALPASVRVVLNILADQMVGLTKQLDAMEAQMRKRCREDADAARLITIPGVGIITACTVLASVPNIHAFRSGRGFAAWLGLVPRQTSSGGKARLGRITKMGDPAIRRLLVVGATSAIRWAKQKDGYDESWLGKMLARKPVKVAAVALANKNARIIWALLTRQEAYRPA